MNHLSRDINDTHTTVSKFDLVSQILVIYCLVTYSLEPYDQVKGSFFYYSEIVITIIFFIEYLLRVYLADNKKKFVSSWYGIIDLFSFLPSLLTFGIVDLRFIRILRLFRLMRLLKFLKSSQSIMRLREAFNEIRSELATFLFLIFIMVYLSSVGIFLFEHPVQPEKFPTIAGSMWWALATLSTVGYGDVYPVTVGGKIFTSIILILGIGLISVPSGLFASSLTKNK